MSRAHTAQMLNWINQHPTPFVIALFVLLFILWPLSLIAVSYWSGWASLAQRFSLDGRFDGPTWQFRSGRMRYWTRYSNILTIGADAKGFYLAITISIFSAGHPPLLIPWREILVSDAELPFLRWTKFELGRDLFIPFPISGALGDRLRSAAGSNWPGGLT